MRIPSRGTPRVVAIATGAAAVVLAVLTGGLATAATAAPPPPAASPPPAAGPVTGLLDGATGLVPGLLGTPGAGRSPTAPIRPAWTWARASTAALHPGINAETDGGGVCTTNFVFTAGPRTFLGQAAHCAGTGEATETDGCRSATLPLGTPVRLRGADGGERLGTLAYSSWISMQEAGETDPQRCALNDFALVELAQTDVGSVNPSVPFFGGPTGLDTDGVGLGEQVFTYGNSPLRLGVEQLRPKVGVAAAGSPDGLGGEVYTVTPGVPGDSGSAFLDERGAAVGLLSTLNLAPLPVSNGMTRLAQALEYAGRHGGPDGLALVTGTEAFTAYPVGIPATELAPPAGPPPTDG